MMKICVGSEMSYECPQPTPMILNLNINFTRVSDLVGRDELVFEGSIPATGYSDSFGNWCTRVIAPKGRTGRTRVSADAVVNEAGMPDVVAPQAQQFPVPNLPEETLLFLFGSRYCETDRLSETAWKLFGQTPTGYLDELDEQGGDVRIGPGEVDGIRPARAPATGCRGPSRPLD